MRWLRSLFAWRTVKDTGVWKYRENAITGRRKAVWSGGGYQPLDAGFLRPGDVVIGYYGRKVIESVQRQ